MSRLSIIIPAYNRPDFLRDCVASLRSHTPLDTEIIVVDDGSTDSTPSVARSLPITHFLEQKNQGPATARNLGFQHSSGDLVAFVDCDDEWLPGASDGVLQAFEDHRDLDVLFADARMGNRQEGFTSWIEVAGQDEFFHLPCQISNSNLRLLERGPFFRRMACRNAVFISATVMRREAFERMNGFDVRLCGAADWELWLRMASELTFGFYSTPLAIYTRHSSGMSNNHDVMREDFIRALQCILEKCPALEEDSRRLVEHQLTGWYKSQAYSAFSEGNYRLARERYRRLRTRCHLSTVEWSYFLLSHTSPRLVEPLRSLKHATGL